MIPIVFDKSVRQLIFGILGKTVDGDGYLVERDNLAQRVLTPEGEYIKPKEIGIIRPGSQIFIKKDIVSLMKFATDLV